MTQLLLVSVEALALAFVLFVLGALLGLAVGLAWAAASIVVEGHRARRKERTDR